MVAVHVPSSARAMSNGPLPIPFDPPPGITCTFCAAGCLDLEYDAVVGQDARILPRPAHWTEQERLRALGMKCQGRRDEKYYTSCVQIMTQCRRVKSHICHPIAERF